jgi:hypothetical protein
VLIRFSNRRSLRLEGTRRINHLHIIIQFQIQDKGLHPKVVKELSIIIQTVMESAIGLLKTLILIRVSIMNLSLAVRSILFLAKEQSQEIWIHHLIKKLLWKLMQEEFLLLINQQLMIGLLHKREAGKHNKQNQIR